MTEEGGDFLPFQEDDEFVYIPEELFQYLPEPLRAEVKARQNEGQNVLKIADADINNLSRLLKAIPTASSLSYIYHRLRKAVPDLTAEAMMEQEMLTTAFVVTYARLFVSGNGGAGVSRDRIPQHLLPVHDDILEIRHQRYAHNGNHRSVDGGVRIDFDGTDFFVVPELTLGMHLGGRNEWEELIRFIDAHMHERLYKILRRLKDKTGYEWKFPTGPAPDWVGDYGDN